MTITWLPGIDGLSWKAFARDAPPGSRYRGYVRKMHTGHYVAIDKYSHRSFSATTMHAAASWLIGVACPRASN